MLLSQYRYLDQSTNRYSSGPIQAGHAAETSGREVAVGELAFCVQHSTLGFGLLASPTRVLFLDGQLNRLLFGELLDAVLALPGGDAIENLPEWHPDGFAKITPESVLYDV